MAISYNDLIQDLLEHAPDPNEPLPAANKKVVIYAIIMPFLVLAWIAVAFRMWVRFRIVRNAGLDDALVFLAALLNTAASIFVVFSIDYGFGRHFLYLSSKEMAGYIKMFYFENALYTTNTAVIKLSLLTQYMRIFKAGMMRWICIALMILIGLWGISYGFMAWFPCFPPSAYYNRLSGASAVTCYAYGFSDIPSFIGIFESHTALNMVFDLLVFCTPMILFKKPDLKTKNLLAMTGVFLFGGVVVVTSVWRLYSIVDNKAATYPYIDFTWWTPISIVLSSLEINLAIMTASMPIFWPVIEQSFAAIFITQEVHVTEQRRYSLTERSRAYTYGSEHELEHSDRESLVISRQPSAKVGLEEHYKDPYLMNQVDPFGEMGHDEGLGYETNVGARPKDKWVL